MDFRCRVWRSPASAMAVSISAGADESAAARGVRNGQGLSLRHELHQSGWTSDAGYGARLPAQWPSRSHQVQTKALRPAAFGTAKGFRFDMSFTSPDGLQMQGMALACQRNGRLDLI